MAAIRESDIVSTQILNSDLIVPPNIINRNIDTSLLNILKKKIEDKCLSEGYIIKGSTKIIERSTGIYDKFNNDGNFKYNITFSVLVCLPVKEDILLCIIEDINKAGIVANKLTHQITNKQHPINIKVIIPTEYFRFNNLPIESYDIGDELYVKVVASRLKYNDNSILVIARGL